MDSYSETLRINSWARSEVRSRVLHGEYGIKDFQFKAGVAGTRGETWTVLGSRQWGFFFGARGKTQEIEGAIGLADGSLGAGAGYELYGVHSFMGFNFAGRSYGLRGHVRLGAKLRVKVGRETGVDIGPVGVVAESGPGR
ncbi:hypothetical protein ACFLQU_03865 [Verrucomicrobiota bacterium]